MTMTATAYPDDRFFMQHAFNVDSPTTRVQLAADGQQALDRLVLIDPLPDMVLLNPNLPGLSGFEVETIASLPINTAGYLDDLQFDY